MKREIVSPKHPLPRRWKIVDAVIVLNVFSEPKRLAHAREQLKKIGLAECAFVIKSEKDVKNPARGCYRSHRYAAKFSLKRKWNRTLLFEDNFYVLEDPLPKLSKSLKALPSNWFLLKIGHFPILPIYSPKTKLWKGRALWCTAQVFSKDYARWFPEWKFVEGGIMNYVTRLGGKSIDHVHMSDLYHKTYMTIPSLVYVGPNYGRASSVGKFFGSNLSTQRCMQYLFPLFYIVILFYLLYRVWCFKTLASSFLWGVRRNKKMN